MERVIIIGCPGSGKSTFARKLRDLTGLPLTYLDKLWHKADRTNVTTDEFDAALNAVLKTGHWIIDGNYTRTLEARLKACDTVFFLDYPLEVCLEGAAARIGTAREDLPWLEEEFDPEFRQYILDYPESHLPKVRTTLDEYRDGREIIVFHSREESEEWLNQMPKPFHIIRAVEEYQRAGAYYVRIQAMARAYHISLRDEFDDIDGPDCHYILALDGEFPAATCRWFETEPDTVEIGRVVVLPEYREHHLGSLVVKAAEEWIAEAGYRKIVISSRKGVEPFYEKLGFRYNSAYKAHSTTFECVYMEKIL